MKMRERSDLQRRKGRTQRRRNDIASKLTIEIEKSIERKSREDATRQEGTDQRSLYWQGDRNRQGLLNCHRNTHS